MPVVETRTLNVEYEERGQGPELVVLVHGNYASPRWWGPVLERLPAGYRAIAPTLRGSGNTRGRTTSFSMAQLAADLRELAETLGLPPFHLVGHSLGGAVAMQFALDYPHLVRTLVLVAPAPAAGLGAMRRADTRLARALAFVDPDHEPSMAMLHGSIRAARMLGTHRASMRHWIEQLLPSALRDERHLAGFVEDAVSVTPEASVGYLQALHRWNVEDRLGQLRAPTLIVAGARDPIVPSFALEDTIRLVPDGELEVWPDAGHAPHLEAPEAFVDRFVTFVTTRDTRASRLGVWLHRLWILLWTLAWRLGVPVTLTQARRLQLPARIQGRERDRRREPP